MEGKRTLDVVISDEDDQKAEKDGAAELSTNALSIRGGGRAIP